MIFGLEKVERLCTLRMKCLIIASAVSKSAITPFAHRADRLDRAGGPAQHQLGVLAHGQDLLDSVLDVIGHDGRLGQDHALALYVDQRVRRPEVNGHVRREHAHEQLSSPNIEIPCPLPQGPRLCQARSMRPYRVRIYAGKRAERASNRRGIAVWERRPGAPFSRWHDAPHAVAGCARRPRAGAAPPPAITRHTGRRFRAMTRRAGTLRTRAAHDMRVKTRSRRVGHEDPCQSPCRRRRRRRHLDRLSPRRKRAGTMSCCWSATS